MEIKKKKVSEMTEETNTEGFWLFGYNENRPIEDRSVKFAFDKITSVFGVTQEKGQSTTLAPSLKLFTDEVNKRAVNRLTDYPFTVDAAMEFPDLTDCIIDLVITKKPEDFNYPLYLQSIRRQNNKLNLLQISADGYTNSIGTGMVMFLGFDTVFYRSVNGFIYVKLLGYLDSGLEGYICIDENALGNVSKLDIKADFVNDIYNTDYPSLYKLLQTQIIDTSSFVTKDAIVSELGDAQDKVINQKIVSEEFKKRTILNRFSSYPFTKESAQQKSEWIDIILDFAITQKPEGFNYPLYIDIIRKTGGVIDHVTVNARGYSNSIGTEMILFFGWYGKQYLDINGVRYIRLYEYANSGVQAVLLLDEDKVPEGNHYGINIDLANEIYNTEYPSLYRELSLDNEYSKMLLPLNVAPYLGFGGETSGLRTQKESGYGGDAFYGDYISDDIIYTTRLAVTFTKKDGLERAILMTGTRSYKEIPASDIELNKEYIYTFSGSATSDNVISQFRTYVSDGVTPDIAFEYRYIKTWEGEYSKEFLDDLEQGNEHQFSKGSAVSEYASFASRAGSIEGIETKNIAVKDYVNRIAVKDKSNYTKNNELIDFISGSRDIQWILSGGMRIHLGLFAFQDGVRVEYAGSNKFGEGYSFKKNTPFLSYQPENNYARVFQYYMANDTEGKNVQKYVVGFWIDRTQLQGLPLQFSSHGGGTWDLTQENLVTKGYVAYQRNVGSKGYDQVEVTEVDGDFSYITIRSDKSKTDNPQLFNIIIEDNSANLKEITLWNPTLIYEEQDINPYHIYLSESQKSNSVVRGKTVMVMGDSQQNDGEISAGIARKLGVNIVHVPLGGHRIKYQNATGLPPYNGWMYHWDVRQIVLSQDVDYYFLMISSNDSSGGGDSSFDATETVLEKYPVWGDDAATIQDKLDAFNALSEADKLSIFDYKQTYSAFIKQLSQRNPGAKFILATIPISSHSSTDNGQWADGHNADTERTTYNPIFQSIRNDIYELSLKHSANVCDLYTKGGIMWENFPTKVAGLDSVHWTVEAKKQFVNPIIQSLLE